MNKRYQIFISSTFVDLQEERKAIIEAIIELNCFPIGMEMFPATDTEQFEYIKSVIDECDYYIVVISGKYGSLSEEGISYTEKEFEYAISKGVPVLAFLYKDLDKLPAAKIENDFRKKKKLENFRNKISESRMVRYWENEYELKYVIHASMSREMKVNPRIGWVKADELDRMKAIIKKETIEELQEKEINENTDIDEILSNIKKKINLPVEYPEGKYSNITISISEFMIFAGTALMSRCSNKEFINLVNSFVEHICHGDNVWEQSSAIMPGGLSMLKMKMFAYDIIKIENIGSMEYYIYSNIGKQVLKEIGK